MKKCSIIVPTIGKNEMILSLLRQISLIDDDIVKHVYIYDNGMPIHTRDACLDLGAEVIESYGEKIYSMWNKGVLKSSLDEDIEYVCIFNDDLHLFAQPNWFKLLVSPLVNDDVWATCANYNPEIHNEPLEYKSVIGTFKDNGFAGFCFCVSKKAYMNGLHLFDERYNWWFGDDDFVHSIHQKGKKTTISMNAHMLHIYGGSQTVVQYTPEFNQMVEEDRILYYSKWH